MKFVGRILWLLLGLLWRLVVLVLFEKWIPLPDRTEEALAPQPRRARREQERREQPRAEPLVTPPGPFELERALRAQQRRADKARPPFFPAQSSELSPELAAQREGEHWLPPRSRVSLERGPARVDVLLARGPARVDAPRAGRALARHESLASLLRDKRALSDAVVLGAAMGARRPKL